MMQTQVSLRESYKEYLSQLGLGLLMLGYLCFLGGLLALFIGVVVGFALLLETTDNPILYGAICVAVLLFGVCPLLFHWLPRKGN